MNDHKFIYFVVQMNMKVQSEVIGKTQNPAFEISQKSDKLRQQDIEI